MTPILLLAVTYVQPVTDEGLATALRLKCQIGKSVV